MKNRFMLFGATALLLAIGCRKQPDIADTANTTGSINIHIQNMAGAAKLELNNKWYMNENGDSIKITTFNYFISNIKFVKEDGTEYVQPESYYLIEENKTSSQSFTLNNVPAGKYKAIKFLIGVDSARNVSGAQTGALDQGTGMFWDWNTGYIMAKMEAESPQAVQTGGSVIYHLGGYSGSLNVLRTVNLPLSSFEITNTKSRKFYLKADALQWFKTPNTISVKDLSVLAGASALKIADNYSDMFSIDYID